MPCVRACHFSQFRLCVRACVRACVRVCVCVCHARACAFCFHVFVCARVRARVLVCVTFPNGIRVRVTSSALHSQAVTQGRLFILKSECPAQGRSCLPSLLFRRSLRGTLPPRSHQGETPLTQPQTKVSTTVFQFEDGLDNNNTV